MTFPTDPDDLETLKKLAARNIANGDWGDEVTFPGETVPLSPEEREAKMAASDILSKSGRLRLPKKK